MSSNCESQPHVDRKRKQDAVSSDAVSILKDDLTSSHIDEFFGSSLTDRQRLSWAYQTEARVRLAKLQARDSAQEKSHTLDSEYLFDVYPINDKAEATSTANRSVEVPAEHRHQWNRPCLPHLGHGRAPDPSFRTLVRLDLSEHNPQASFQLLTPPFLPLPENHPLYQPATVPPNYYFFRVILDAYLGYQMRSFHSTDPTVPRCALQGGAVVAALTAWRDLHILSLFQKAQLHRWFLNASKNSEKYRTTLTQVTKDLQDYFLYDDEDEDYNSPFATGDADIFVQASPLTRNLMMALNGLPAQARALIEEYTGGCGILQRDTEALVKILFRQDPDLRLWNWKERPGSYLPSKTSSSDDDRLAPDDCFNLLFAVTRNAVNLMLVQTSEYYTQDLSWPRNTQLIQLSAQADLLGGLLDFDISLVSCAFDGNTVRITPRSAVSLMTGTQNVTPFILQEQRNWTRIVKYYKRGFPAYVIDPNCHHEIQCAKGPFRPPHRIPTKSPSNHHTDKESSDSEEDVNDENGVEMPDSEEVTAHQNEEGVEFLCGHGERTPFAELSYVYSFVLIEKKPYDILEFFAQRDQWTDEKRAEMNEIHPWSRVCCRRCRWDYSNYCFVQTHRDFGERIEKDEDEILAGQAYERGARNAFLPSFYSGGAFDGKRNRINNPWLGYRAMATLNSQLMAEKARYHAKHQTPKGYKPRFVHGTDVQQLFRKSGEGFFSTSNRNPVGLNPERFVNQCIKCQAYMLESEFGTVSCEQCSTS